MKEEIYANYVSTGCESVVIVCFSRSSYVSGIEEDTGAHVIVQNKVEVPYNDTRYMQRLFETDNFYATRNPRFESFMFNAGTSNEEGENYNKLWFAKALEFLSIKYKAMMRPDRISCMAHSIENFDPC